MKRTLALMLGLTIMFALCGCGKSSLTQAEREEIFYEVAKEKGLDLSNPAVSAWQQTKEAMTEAPPPQSTLAPLYDAGPSPTNSDFINIEEVRLVPVKGGKFRPNIKVRCLYPEGALQVYPQEAWIYCNYLNNDDEVIQSFCGVFKHLGYNQAMWSKATNYSHMNGDDIFDPNEISKIRFTYYHMITIAGGRTSWQNEWDFLTPITFNVEDLEIE